MKPSHLRTPRTLAECYFEVGHVTIEPSMWRNQPDSTPNTTKTDLHGRNWQTIGLIAATGILIVLILVQPYF